VVLRRRRHRLVLRHLPAAGQYLLAAGDGERRIPARRRRTGDRHLHGAGERPLHRLRR
jgi:hypothetical protein